MHNLTLLYFYYIFKKGLLYIYFLQSYLAIISRKAYFVTICAWKLRMMQLYNCNKDAIKWKEWKEFLRGYKIFDSPNEMSGKTNHLSSKKSKRRQGMRIDRFIP